MMHRISFSRLKRKLRGKKDDGESAAQPISAATLVAANNQVRSPATPLSAAPCSSIQPADPEPFPVPTPGRQLTLVPPSLVHAQPESLDIHASYKPNLPKPYATTAGLWNEALAHLDDPEKRKSIENLLGEPDHDATNSLHMKDLAVEVRDKIDVAFEMQKHDSRTRLIINKAVTFLSKFVSAVDVAVSFDPVHATLPWAVVRSVLVILTSNSELQSQILAGIATVASLLAQCDTYQQLYMAPDLSLRPPEIILSKLKTSIIQTYTKSQFFLSFAIQSKTRLVIAPLELGDASNNINELSRFEKQLSQDADNCEKYCNLSNRYHMEGLLKLNTALQKILQNEIELVLEQMGRDDQIRMLEWISPIPYTSHHNRLKESRTRDTCEWLLGHEKFHAWEKARTSMVLWLQGTPGAGKSYLASKVVDHFSTLLKKSPHLEGFVFFYCDRNEEQRRKPLSILQSLVRKLSTTIKDTECIRKQLQDLCRERRRNGSDLSFDDCREQLLESVNLYTHTTLVIDAFDECEETSRGKILRTIEDLLSRPENHLRVLISSRPDHDLRNWFLHKPSIEIKATDNQEDIQKFIQEEITKHTNWGTMSPDLREKIVEVLHSKSQGMFQWAFLQIKHILSLKTPRAILDRLGKLPPDLKTAYDEIYG